MFSELSSVTTSSFSPFAAREKASASSLYWRASWKRKMLRLRVVLVGQFQFLRAVAVGVERRLDLDEALVAVEDHDLAGGKLGGDVEAQLEIAEIGPTLE